eukprot:m.157150 g.157150  ORF g.157150 m.157150 type:complete len:738 (-) comp31042_c2_seq2:38-2251(-)
MSKYQESGGKKGICGCKSYASELQEHGLAGPRENGSRHCTDPLTLLIFFAYLFGMIVIAVLSVDKGNADRLIMGSDSFGNVCGKKNDKLFNNSNSGLDMTDYDFVYYVDPVSYFSGESPALCVKECPGNDGGMGNVSASACLLCGVSDTSDTCKYCRMYGVCLTQSNASRYTAEVSSNNDYYNQVYISTNDNCPIYIYKSKPVLSRCIPDLTNEGNDIISAVQDDQSATSGSVTQTYSDVVNGDIAAYFETIWESFWNARVKLVYLLLTALAFSVLMIVMMRYFVGVFVWLVIFVVHAALICLCCMLWYDYLDRYNTIDDARGVNSTEVVSNEQIWTRDFMLVLAIIASVVTLILMMITIAMRKSIRIAIAVFEEASKAIAAAPSLFVLPFTTFVAVVCTALLWMWVGLYIVTWDVAHENNQSGLVEYEHSTTSYREDEVPNEDEFNLIWVFYFFGLLWGLQFIVAAGSFITSGSIVTWYFAGPHSDETEKKAYTGHKKGCLGATFMFLRYHIGTVCLGSLVIAIIQMLRAILAYIQKKYGKAVGKIGRFVMCCCQCCLWLLEKCMKYVNKNAYAITAIHGYHFWSAACTAFGNILHNIFLVAAVNGVGYLVLSLIKILVVTLNIFCCYLLFYKDSDSSDGMWYLMVMVGIFTWVIIDAFTDLYSTAIDTILMSYLEDQKHNDGTQQKPYHAGSGLQRFLHNQAKALGTEIKDHQGNPAHMQKRTESGRSIVKVTEI